MQPASRVKWLYDSDCGKNPYEATRHEKQMTKERVLFPFENFDSKPNFIKKRAPAI